jgi:hypothetical protein
MPKNGWRTKFSKTFFLSLLGVFAALLVAEICLRPFVTGRGGYILPTQDSLEKLRTFEENPAHTVEIRQFQEGFAAAHFTADGARVTGNEKIENAPIGLILGDSFVEAIQVNDNQVFGSVVERLSREAGKPVNVREYGWAGTSTATYLAVADALQQRWNPKWVTIVYNDDDFSKAALQGGRFWLTDVAPDLSVNITPAKRTADRYDAQLRKVGLSSNSLYNLVNSSSLAYAAIEKYLLFGNPKSELANPQKMDFAEEKMVATASVRALKKAYGDKLLIVYISHVTVISPKESDEIEGLLRTACQDEQVEFVSTRPEMLAQLENNKRLSQGFSNTPPSIGHLNSFGHEIVGQAIWNAVSKR